MSSLFGDPALRLLARRKLRASLRTQRRRLRTPKGALFTIMGALLFLLWATTLFVPNWGRGHVIIGDPEDLRSGVRLGALILTLLSLSSAFSHRGLFLPSDEIQRLFSAPVQRSDLIRYRLIATITRSLVGAIIVGIVVMRRMPSPPLALVGVLLAVATLPVMNQFLAILGGGVEDRWAKRLGSTRGLFLVLAAVGIVVIVLNMTSPSGSAFTFEDLPGLDPGALLESHWLSTVTLPFEPWARMVTASSVTDFLPWFLLCLAIALLLFELTARLPIDYRELSLQTAASVAARVRRVRRGGGVASGKASKSLAAVRVPWLFGRHPAGAIAWRKTAAILRKAKGTLWVSGLVLVFLTVIGRGSDNAMPLIAILGTFYLTSGLRFDFRDDLDRMEVIKAWPVAPARIFAATLLPEVLLVAFLVTAALSVHAVTAGGVTPLLLAVMAFLPLFVFAWVAVDNAVYLYAPVRFVPGQEGALQNAGRGVLLMFLRGLVLIAVTLACGGPAFLVAYLCHRFLDMPEEALRLPAAVVAWVLLIGCNVVLVLVGGGFLRRFDVARDRG